MSRTAMIRALVVVTGVLLPSAPSAQSPAPAPQATVGNPEQLEALAASPKSSMRDWVEAAQALERAATLRPASDPRALNDILGAATAYQVAGMLVPARRNAVEGAKRALARGDVYTAANAYVAAARFSLELRDEAGVMAYLGRANQLAASPGLTAQQTCAISAQVGKQ